VGVGGGGGHLDDGGVPPVQVGRQPGHIQADSATDGNDGLLPPAESILIAARGGSSCSIRVLALHRLIEGVQLLTSQGSSW